GKTKKLTIRNKSDQIRMVSSNPSVATVDESGRVMARDPGTAIINLMVGSEVYDSCTVTVLAPAFNQNGASLKLKLKKTVNPAPPLSP
ncbi:MAG: Ig-like domain-containing protein, partial [Lachnospiraceae bacterium]|nr:Ig-like domain-containing protein [Lachnospiraceae bacterium]